MRAHTDTEVRLVFEEDEQPVLTVQGNKRQGTARLAANWVSWRKSEPAVVRAGGSKVRQDGSTSKAYIIGRAPASTLPTHLAAALADALEDHRRHL
jgi:hypothetical protein